MKIKVKTFEEIKEQLLSYEYNGFNLIDHTYFNFMMKKYCGETINVKVINDHPYKYIIYDEDTGRLWKLSDLMISNQNRNGANSISEGANS